MAAKLPAAIIVGPYRYEVTADELARLRVEHAEQKVLSGHSDHDALRINVDTGPAVAADTSRDTVLHEVLHAIAFLSGLSSDWGTQREEEIVRRLSPLLLDVLRRNPALVAYLLEDA